MSDLSPSEIQRYSRHLLLPEVGLQGQKKLKAAAVLCVGAGGLGSPLALYLAAAGVGRLGIVDFDSVDFSNLQRQVLHSTPDVGRSKLESARERLLLLNPEVDVVCHETRLNSANALQIIGEYDIVADGTDNFPTRYLVNDACFLTGRPNAFGSIFRFEGQASVFAMPGGPCYRCLFPQPPPPGAVPSCAEGGVLGVLPGMVGTIQAIEVIKLILGIGKPLVGRLLVIDALDMTFRKLKFGRRDDCPLCGSHPTITELVDYEDFCGVVEQDPSDVPSITAHDLHRRMCDPDSLLVLDVREAPEAEICRLAGSMLIPLDQLPDRAGELDREREIVAYCRSGVRSAQAAQWLIDAGFKVHHLEGGILAWARDVDPSMPQY